MMIEFGKIQSNTAGVCMPKDNIRNTRKRCEICSKWRIKTPGRRYWRHSGVFFVNFEQISHNILVLLLLTLSNQHCVKSVSISLRIQSECGKIRTRKISVFGHFSGSVNVKINARLAGVTNKNGKGVLKRFIQLGFIDSCRFIASSLDKLASNICETKGIQCDMCKGDVVRSW